jgi:8-oxo-dGTP diphosphatase
MKKERFKVIPAVYLILEKENKFLLIRRFRTGYKDGHYSLIAGHLDGQEFPADAMIRVAKEEAGIDIDKNEIKFVHIMHRILENEEERVDLFFNCKKWNGVVTNLEPHKCDDMQWFDMDKLPSNTLAYVREAIESYKKGLYYSESFE